MKTIKIGSSTRAARARDMLSEYGIDSKIKKLGNQREGCVHALSVGDNKANAALRLLRSAGLRASFVEEGRPL